MADAMHGDLSQGILGKKMRNIQRISSQIHFVLIACIQMCSMENIRSLMRFCTQHVTQIVIFSCLVGCSIYFVASSIRGNSGLHAYILVNERMKILQKEYTTIAAYHDEIENKTQRLRDEPIDLDLLDERARYVLGYVHPSDKVLIEARER
jgi:cell division protein FtsB